MVILVVSLMLLRCELRCCRSRWWSCSSGRLCCRCLIVLVVWLILKYRFCWLSVMKRLLVCVLMWCFMSVWWVLLVSVRV